MSTWTKWDTKRQLYWRKQIFKKKFFLIETGSWLWFLQFCLLHFSILSMWTLKRPPTYLAWTIVDIWLTTHPPYLVHVVCEWPLSALCNKTLFFASPSEMTWGWGQILPSEASTFGKPPHSADLTVKKTRAIKTKREIPSLNIFQPFQQLFVVPKFLSP